MLSTDVTAVVQSRVPYTRTFDAFRVLNTVQVVDAAGLCSARLDSIRQVTTPWFFFLDDDDDLPDNHADLIQSCIDLATHDHSKVVYTNELVESVDGSTKVTKVGKYSQEAHLSNYALVHHLALYSTQAALDALKVIPRGLHWAELLLAWQVAKSGASYLDEVGYIWNRGLEGAHAWPKTIIAQVQSATWCARNRQ